MRFSTILFTINQIKDAQKHGLAPQEYRIDTTEVINDYEAMVDYYENQAPNDSLEAIKDFKREVQQFYLIVKDMYLDLGTPELEIIYTETRKIRESLVYFINTKESQSEQ